ncbi:MAG: coproporphyrinogen-III oxidase family protein [Acetivibrionales bacterium]|jgi:coproporphyrinogen III oxidase-like Fe-S oxidoreductase
MSILADLTRMWLTRRVQPFTFKNESYERLPFSECEDLGLYIHIPFCESICSFCPYCKVKYSKELCDRYLDALIHEIRLVGGQSDGKKKVTSLYFGGGTPALAADRIHEVIEAVREHFEITEGIGAELHPDNVTVPTLQVLKASGVTKISIGVQSFQEKYQDVLGRKTVDKTAMAKALSAVPFETVSMDFIFALPGQTFEDLKKDIDTAFENGANHVAIYPFIDFTFTKSTVASMPKKEKRALLDAITGYCQEKGYERNSIWTFSKERHASYSSMTRDNFLGFGCSATTLLMEQFKINTFSVEEYCKRIEAGKLPTSLTIRFSLRQRMVYYLFWRAYTTRVNSSDFEKFFGIPLKKMYGFEIWIAKLLGFIVENNGTYSMTLKGAFYYHYYESFYTLAYIDKMWGIMSKEAFPECIKL